jgi:hypothetical protein
VTACTEDDLDREIDCGNQDHPEDHEDAEDRRGMLVG